MLEKSVSGVTTQTVFYLFRHLFIILICIFNQFILIQFIRASSLRMLFYAKWLLTSNQYNIC